MGTNYKATLIPQSIRDTIHGWGKDARRRRRWLGIYGDDSMVHTDTSTVISVEELELREPVPTCVYMYPFHTMKPLIILLHVSF